MVLWTHLFPWLEFLAVEAVEEKGEEEVEYHEVAHDQGGQEDGQAGLRVTLPILSTCYIISVGQGWAKLVLIALERYSVALKRLTFNLRSKQGHLNVIRTNVLVCLEKLTL